MQNKIKISVCIPTYNRPKDLKRCLGLIIPQLTDECELIIRDDSDSDDSQDVIKELVNNTANKANFEFSYFKGSKIGLDLANIFLLEHAQGEFVWWFSDDDEMKDGAIDHLLRIIKANSSLTFIWMNFKSSTTGHLAVSGREDGFFKGNGDFIDTTGPSIGLLSCFVLNRKKGLPHIELAKSRSIGFGFASMVPIMGAISEDDKIYFVNGPFIINYPDNMDTIRSRSEKNDLKMGSQAFEVYAINFPDTLRLFEKKLDKQAIRRLVARNFKHFWRGFIIGQALGYDTVSGKRTELIKRYWWHPEFVVAFLLMQLPTVVLNLLYLNYRKIKLHWIGIKNMGQE